MRGRKPKPTKQKVVEGTARKDRQPANEPIVPPGEPDCPPIVMGEARAEWKRMVTELRSMGLLERVGRGPLATYCLAWATWHQAQEAIAQLGTAMPGAGGVLTVSPYFRIAKAAHEQMRHFWIEYGITPASRARVSVAKPDDDGPADGFDL